MHRNALSFLACPRCGYTLSAVDLVGENNEITHGVFECAQGCGQYPIQNGVPVEPIMKLTRRLPPEVVVPVCYALAPETRKLLDKYVSICRPGFGILCKGPRAAAS